MLLVLAITVCHLNIIFVPLLLSSRKFGEKLPMAQLESIHCITLYYAHQEISWKPGKTSKFRLIHSTIQIWTDFHKNEAKKKFFFWRKKFKMADFSKWPFFKIANSRNFFVKISQIGPWVSRIDWCEAH